MRFIIAVGGNIGDVPATARRAQGLLTESLCVLALATWRRTHALTLPGAPAQADYWNSAWLVASELGPHSMLTALQRAETACGRTRSARWAPRTLDLDLILWEGGAVDSPVLTIPHRLWTTRDFVREPVGELLAMRALVPAAWLPLLAPDRGSMLRSPGVPAPANC